MIRSLQLLKPDRSASSFYRLVLALEALPGSARHIPIEVEIPFLQGLFRGEHRRFANANSATIMPHGVLNAFDRSF